MNKYVAFILIDYKLFVLIMEINVNMLQGMDKNFQEDWRGWKNCDGKNTVVMNKYATAWGTAYHDELFLCKLSFLLFLLFINDLNSGASFSHFCVSFNNPSGGKRALSKCHQNLDEFYVKISGRSGGKTPARMRERGRGEEGEANATKGLVMFEPCKFIHTKEQPKTHTWKTRKKK